MTRRIPRTTRTDTRFPYETLFRSHGPTRSLCGAGQPTSATLRHVSPSPLSEPESERDGMSDEYSGPLLSAPADARFLLHPGDESRDPVFESLWVRTRTAGDAAGDAPWSARSEERRGGKGWFSTG